MSADMPEMSARQAAGLMPKARFGGPIAWLLGILIALVVISAAGGLALRNLADNARSDLSGMVTVQILEANPQTRSERAQAAASVLASQPGVTSVRVIPEQELLQLLKPWLGTGVMSEDIPIPALLDVELTTAAEPEAITRLQAALDRVAPEAKIDAQSSWLRPVYDAITASQWMAWSLIALIAVATGAAVWLSARNAFLDHRGTVEIIHLLGGTDEQVTRVFQRTVLREASFGALLGVAIGAPAVWWLGQQFAKLDSGMVSGGQFGFEGWLILAAIPVAGVVLAMITARITISLALKAML